MTEAKRTLLDELKSRGQVDESHEIMFFGSPAPIRMPGVMHWTALRSMHPILDDLIRGVQGPDGRVPLGTPELHADTVGIALCLAATPEDQLPTEEDIDAFIAQAKRLNHNELEQDFLYIFFECHQSHKKVFLEAGDRAAAMNEKPVGADGKAVSRKTKPTTKPARKPASRKPATSS